jgi:hypothetical protein
MSIKPLVLALGLTLGLLVAPPAGAEELPPLEVTLERAWRVADGAAVEVAYTVSCPEASESGDLHALWAASSPAPDAPRDYVEFWCYPDEPQRVVLLAHSWYAPPGSEVTLTTSATNWLFAPWEEGNPNAHRVETTDTTTVKRGAFEPESWADIKADLRLLRTRLTRDGGVRVVHRATCDTFNGGPISTEIVQRTDEGTVWARGWPGDGWLECSAGEKLTLKYVVQPTGGQTFTRGKAIVEGLWQMCEEFCPRGVSSDEVRLRLPR